jgi:hypothetical protein
MHNWYRRIRASTHFNLLPDVMALGCTVVSTVLVACTAEKQ